MVIRKRKWCVGCNTWFRGKWETCCNKCFKIKKDENTLCMNCKSPDCKEPYLPLRPRGRIFKKSKKFKNNPEWDFRGLSIDEMENQSPNETNEQTDYWFE